MASRLVSTRWLESAITRLETREKRAMQETAFRGTSFVQRLHKKRLQSLPPLCIVFLQATEEQKRIALLQVEKGKRYRTVET